MPSPSPDNLKSLEAFEGYLRDVAMRAPRTVRSYCRYAAQFAAHLGDRAIANATSLDVLAFLGRGELTSVRGGRVRWNLELSGVRALYRWLVGIGVVEADPTARIGRQRIPVEEPDALSLDEMVRLVEAAREQSPRPQRSRNVALLLTFMHTALRVAEVVSLDVAQVDLQAHVLHAVRRKGGKIVAVPVNDVVVAALEQHLADRPATPAAATTALFLSQGGERLAIRTVQQLVRSYARKAGIGRRVTPHLLRHSSASQLAALGTPVRVIQEICAHSSITTTQRYLHVADRDRQDAVDRLGRAFLSQQGARRALRSSS